MIREQHIPLFLWIATAVLVHLLWGGGAQEVSKLIDEKLDVQRFAKSVGSRVRREHQSFEVTLEEDAQKQETTDQDSNQNAPAEPEPEQPKPDEQNKLAQELPKKEEPKTEAKKELEKKPEPKKEEPEKKAVPVTPLKAERVEVPKRIAVEQKVKDENQAPNPNAEFIGDHANHVQEQTQAKITSTEQNDPTPNPGANHQGPSSEPGNAQVDDLAQAEDRPGNPDRAPGETTKGSEEHSAAPEPPQNGARAAKAEASHGAPSQRDHGQTNPNAKGSDSRGEREQVASRAVQASPDLVANGGHDSVSEAREARAEQPGQVARKRHLPPPPSSSPFNLLGLGSGGTTANGINLNLSHSAALATVGPDQLAKQILADGERRRSTHRGSWHTSGLERWRSAIENYVPHVKAGNQTALNTALVPFATYLNRIHNRVHPIFAEQFLAHLDELPNSSPFNRQPDMHTELEIVLNRTDGSIVDMGITKPSGVTAFDIGALDSVSRAAPFGTPPKAIVSPDGNVYLHWEFYRDPQYACSTYFAHPKMLRADPKSVPSPPPPSPGGPFGPEENPIPPGAGQREGRLQLPVEPPGSSRRLAAANQTD